MSNTWNATFIGLILLQLAMFGVLGNDARDGTLSTDDLSNVATGATVESGRAFPKLAAYDQSNQRQEVLQGKDQLVILATTCPCETNVVDGWIETAHRRNEQVTLLMPVAPSQLHTFSKSYNALSMRPNDFYKIVSSPSDAKNIRTPLAVHILPNRVVFSTDIGS